MLEQMNAELGNAWQALQYLIETQLLNLEDSIKAEVESLTKQMLGMPESPKFMLVQNSSTYSGKIPSYPSIIDQDSRA